MRGNDDDDNRPIPNRTRTTATPTMTARLLPERMRLTKQKTKCTYLHAHLQGCGASSQPEKEVVRALTLSEKKALRSRKEEPLSIETQAKLDEDASEWTNPEIYNAHLSASTLSRRLPHVHTPSS
jgi:hypothetical protein